VTTAGKHDTIRHDTTRHVTTRQGTSRERKLVSDILSHNTGYTYV